MVHETVNAKIDSELTRIGHSSYALKQRF